MIGSILAMVVVVAAGLAFSAWGLRTRGRRLHDGHRLGLESEPPPLMPDYGADSANRKG
ncbi:MAG: hypothetical protein JO357_10085 [Hyphomicrobiales bacterium]|nr:hypothetical protein [Hyphomicrobiales bacterium]MBV8768257.1 hypothetical protein [Hyphomicrobiales bacterium]MBV9051461.1 hypothetical protein [Hyphomicrobiales bacterium]MBV9137398.1 hypothetical protein [Hyphomicrobiales bacterium]MBV9590341.1 hypothetical protein [Hyphomicrobiales bacterium]